MEIDGGPPPFLGATVDDSFDKNHPHYEDDDDDEESPDTSSNLPLPRDASRSRSVTPIRNLNTLDVTQEITELEKGDTSASSAKGEEEVENVEEDEDDWGDFEESVTAPAPIRTTPPTIPPLQMNNDDDDEDWGAFDQARPSTDRSDDPSDPNSSARSQEAQKLAHQQSLDDWGAFEAPDNQKDDDDDWEAEFSSAPAPPPTITLENLHILEEMLEDGAFWDDGFAEDDCHDESSSMNVVDIPSLFDAEALEKMSNGFDDDEKQKYSKLWLALRVIEEAISLKFDWNKSEIQKNHFKSLKINPVTAKKEVRATAAVFDTSNLLLPTPIQPTTSSTSDSHDTSATTNPKTSSSSPSVDSPSVPAVDFDWDTSGLTNPMNRANQSSAIIDVDFLGSNGVATAYTSTLQKDLEQFGLNGSVKTTAASNGSTILETLMSRANGHSHRYRTPEVLSLDARQLLEKLPDLQYLQSEVLMFPVGTNLPH